MLKKILSLMLVLCLLCSLCLPVSAAEKTQLEAAVNDTADYLLKTVRVPQVGSIGGEWTVMGLARSGCSLPESYLQTYYQTVERYVKDCGGVLHNKKYTEYSRVIVALSAIGKDARNVAGYDLTLPLGDYEKTVWQGLNGPIWALIALDSADYPMPVNPQATVQATRQMYVDRILSCQLADGGWSLYGGTEAEASGDGISDPDITGMALQALAKYQQQPAVAKAVEKALSCMSRQQNAEGGFASWGTVNSESCVQMMVALCELGIPLDDSRFVKNGKTVLDHLMTYYTKGSGFVHVKDGSGSNLMATEQGFYGLVAVLRAQQGKNSLYRMADAETSGSTTAADAAVGLPGKHADVTPCAVVAPGKTFPDISGVNAHRNQTAVEALAARKIIDGKGSGLFDPDANMTRAEFAAIVVRALGLKPKACGAFSDVPAGIWYAPYVGTAYTYGIVAGVGDGTFRPSGTITRQEAAVMVARAARLCGMDTARDAVTCRDVLAQFADYVKVPAWARESLAFCYDSGILADDALEIGGTAAILRCEIAQMLFNLLGSAKLL